MRVLIVRSGSEDDANLATQKRRYPRLFDLLREAGMEVHVCLCGDMAGFGALISSHVKSVHHLPALRPSASGLIPIPSTILRLRSVINRVRPSIIDGSEPFPAIAAGIAARTTRRPLVAYRRHHGTGRTRLALASRLATRLSDVTIVSSDAMAKMTAQDDRVPLERVLVARSGTADLRSVPDHEVAQMREDLGIPAGAVVVGSVARLRREKGIDVLLAAAGQLDPDTTHVVVVGAGPEEAELREVSVSARTPVHFVGHHKDVAPWFRLIDIVAIPSRAESFGRTTVEAMAAGKPIIAARAGGLADAIEDGVTGILVGSEDAVALAAAIERLTKDAVLRDGMGQAARNRFLERHTLEAMADSWIDAWQQILELKAERLQARSS